MVAVRALLVAICLTGCIALGERPEFAHTARDLSEPDHFPAKPGEPCSIHVVPEAPRGAKRLGSIHVPAKLAAEQRIDPQSREYGCALRATHAVKESEAKERGQAIWILGLYRD